MSAVYEAPRTSVELAYRDMRIAYCRAAGMHWSAIAEQVGISERQAKRAARGYIIGSARIAGAAG